MDVSLKYYIVFFSLRVINNLRCRTRYISNLSSHSMSKKFGYFNIDLYNYMQLPSHILYGQKCNDSLCDQFVSNRLSLTTTIVFTPHIIYETNLYPMCQFTFLRWIENWQVASTYIFSPVKEFNSQKYVQLDLLFTCNGSLLALGH